MEVASFCSVGKDSEKKVVPKHDLRRTIPKNADYNLSGDNIILCNEIGEKTVEEYINEIMQPHIDNYNASQKRKDRRILSDYCTYHKENLNTELALEMVLGFGCHEDLGKEFYDPKTNPERKDILKAEFAEIYRNAFYQFKQDFPHLRILQAVVHFDEPQGTPHLHLSFTAITDGYKQKLKTRIGISRALAADGIERLGNRLESEIEGYQYQRLAERVRHDYLEPQLLSRNYVIKPEKGGKRHQNPISELTQKKDEMINEGIKAIRDEQERVFEEVRAAQKTWDNQRSQRKEELKELSQKCAEAKKEHEKEIAQKCAELAEIASQNIPVVSPQKGGKLIPKGCLVVPKDELEELEKYASAVAVTKEHLFVEAEKLRESERKLKKLEQEAEQRNHGVLEILKSVLRGQQSIETGFWKIVNGWFQDILDKARAEANKDRSKMWEPKPRKEKTRRLGRIMEK